MFNKVKTRKQTTYTKHASPKGYSSKGRSGNRRHTHSTQVQTDILLRGPFGYNKMKHKRYATLSEEFQNLIKQHDENRVPIFEGIF
jgi:hypothetical protein